MARIGALPPPGTFGPASPGSIPRPRVPADVRRPPIDPSRPSTTSFTSAPQAAQRPVNPFEQALRRAIDLYSEDPAYSADSHGLLSLLGGISIRDRNASIADWALLEGLRICKNFKDSYGAAIPAEFRLRLDAAFREHNYLKKWILLLQIEMDAPLETKGGTLAQWASIPQQFFRETMHRVSPGSSKVQKIYRRRFDDINGPLEQKLNKLPYLHSFTSHQLALKLSKQIAIVEGKRPLSKPHASELQQVILDHLEAVRRLVPNSSHLPESVAYALVRMSFGEIAAFYDWLKAKMKVPIGVTALTHCLAGENPDTRADELLAKRLRK